MSIFIQLNLRNVLYVINSLSCSCKISLPRTLQLSFYAVLFIRDLAPPGATVFPCAFAHNQGARAGNDVRASAFFRFSVGCRSPPVLVIIQTLSLRAST